MASVFSGKAGRNAGIWATQQALQDWEAGNDIIDKGKTDALGAIDRGRTGGLAALGQGRTDAIGALEAGNAAAHPNYANAIQRFAPWAAAGRKGLDMYGDTLGVNGQEGYDRAVGNFRAGPGYQYQVDQASDAVARKASAMGALGSGNTMAAIADRARNMADAEFGRYQDRLNGLSTQGLAASGQMAGLEQAWGNLAAQLGRDKAGVYTGTGAQEAGIYTGTGAQEAGVYGNATNQGLANLAQMSQTKIGAGTGALMAGQQAAQNRLNFGMQLGQLGMQALGTLAGGGMGSLGSLGSMFSGGAGAGLGGGQMATGWLY
jgi:hypothetical protein